MILQISINLHTSHDFNNFKILTDFTKFNTVLNYRMIRYSEFYLTQINGRIIKIKNLINIKHKKNGSRMRFSSRQFTTRIKRQREQKK